MRSDRPAGLAAVGAGETAGRPLRSDAQLSRSALLRAAMYFPRSDPVSFRRKTSRVLERPETLMVTAVMFWVTLVKK